MGGLPLPLLPIEPEIGAASSTNELGENASGPLPPLLVLPVGGVIYDYISLTFTGPFLFWEKVLKVTILKS